MAVGLIIATVGQLFCALACLTSASRMCFAFSRDRAVPGHRLWTKLNPVTINTAITKVVSGRGGLTVVSYNEHVHLGADLLTYR